MYKELANYQSLYDDFANEDGSFDPFYYIDIDKGKVGLATEYLRLLHDGSFIKLLCYILQAWSQGGYPATKDKTINKIIKLLDSGRIKHEPAYEKYLRLALKSDKHLWLQAKDIYGQYVEHSIKP